MTRTRLLIVAAVAATALLALGLAGATASGPPTPSGPVTPPVESLDGAGGHGDMPPDYESFSTDGINIEADPLEEAMEALD